MVPAPSWRFFRCAHDDRSIDRYPLIPVLCSPPHPPPPLPRTHARTSPPPLSSPYAQPIPDEKVVRRTSFSSSVEFVAAGLLPAEGTEGGAAAAATTKTVGSDGGGGEDSRLVAPKAPAKSPTAPPPSSPVQEGGLVVPGGGDKSVGATAAAAAGVAASTTGARPPRGSSHRGSRSRQTFSSREDEQRLEMDRAAARRALLNTAGSKAPGGGGGSGRSAARHGAAGAGGGGGDGSEDVSPEEEEDGAGGQAPLPRIGDLPAAGAVGAGFTSRTEELLLSPLRSPLPRQNGGESPVAAAAASANGDAAPVPQVATEEAFDPAYGRRWASLMGLATSSAHGSEGRRGGATNGVPASNNGVPRATNGVGAPHADNGVGARSRAATDSESRPGAALGMVMVRSSSFGVVLVLWVLICGVFCVCVRSRHAFCFFVLCACVQSM